MSGVTACAFALFACLSTPSLGQIRLSGESDADWTVLTMAPDGAWGAATEAYVNRAIANAIARCRAMSAGRLGCGAYSVSTQGGWALGLRCGEQSILAVGETLAQATARARRREEELRRHYQPHMADCSHVVSVAPDGSVTAPQTGAVASGRDIRR